MNWGKYLDDEPILANVRLGKSDLACRQIRPGFDRGLQSWLACTLNAPLR